VTHQDTVKYLLHK